MDEQNQNNLTPKNDDAKSEQDIATSPNKQQSLADSEPEPAEGNSPEPAEGWQYQSGNLTQANIIDKPDQPNKSSASANADSISWNASEFLHHEKSGIWYVYVALAAIALAAAVYFITKEIFSVVVIVLIAVAFAVFGALKPKVLEYAIAPDGIQVGQKHFNFEDFRSFAIITEGVLPSIQLLPHKRFAVAITMYCEPQDADKIVGILGKYLPFEHQKRDFTDKLASKIHF